MKLLFSSGSVIRKMALLVFLIATTMPHETQALNAVVNYNEATMWMYNYFRAYLCDGVLPESVCDSLAGAFADEDDLLGDTSNTTTTTIEPEGGAAADNNVVDVFNRGGILGLGIFGGGNRQRRNLRA